MRLLFNKILCYSFLAVLSVFQACDEEEDVKEHADKTVFWNTTADTDALYTASFKSFNIPAISSLMYYEKDDGAKTSVRGGVVDPAKGVIYFFSDFPVALHQADFSFKNFVEVGTLPEEESQGFGNNSAYGAIDDIIYVDNMIYFSQSNNPGRIVSTDVSGASFKTIYTFTTVDTLGTGSLWVSKGSTDMYWSTPTTIWKANTTGTQKPSRFMTIEGDTTYGEIKSMVIYDQTLYLGTTKGIWKAPMSSPTALQLMFSKEMNEGTWDIIDLAIDEQERELYWFCQVKRRGSSDYNFLYRARVDGSQLEKILEKHYGNYLSVY